MSETVKITFNGQEIEVPKGQTLLQAAASQGIDVPVFCYHEGLDKSGYCRMCQVEVDTPRGKRLITACNTPCTDGTVCDTHSDAAVRGRKAVLEFYLVNHPLDCPECDKAGECMLQDNSYGHGNAASRARLEDKIVKPRKDFGDKINFYSQRCVACRRCTQFLDDVSGTSELAFTDRGGHQELDIFPGVGIHNTLAKNIVDICPVGALIDKDFQYTTRQWMMQRVPTTCSGCSKGCATTANHSDGVVRRFQARRDDDVNGFWMCDHGRDMFRTLTENRQLFPQYRGERVSMKEARERAVQAMQNGTSVLVSAFSTEEELDWAEDISGNNVAGALARADGEEETFPGFVIPADKNPNRAGVIGRLGADAFNADRIAEKLHESDTVLVLNAAPDVQIPEAVMTALKGMKNVIVVSAFTSALDRLATVLIPSAAPTEKEGTFVNDKGLRRSLRFCVAPPGAGEMDVDTLKALHKGLEKSRVHA